MQISVVYLTWKVFLSVCHISRHFEWEISLKQLREWSKTLSWLPGYRRHFLDFQDISIIQDYFKKASNNHRLCTGHILSSAFVFDSTAALACALNLLIVYKEKSKKKTHNFHVIFRVCWAPSSRARLGRAKHSFRFRSREASGGGWGLVERIFTDFRTVCNLIIVARKQAWREGAKRKKICRIAGWRTQFSFRLSKNCLEMSILNFCLPDAPTGLASLSSVPRRCKKKSQKPARVLAAKKMIQISFRSS